MFGFVTFVYPETVKLILAKGNPHFVCDSRVLVKPYKEKGKVPDNSSSTLRGVSSLHARLPRPWTPGMPMTTFNSSVGSLITTPAFSSLLLLLLDFVAHCTDTKSLGAAAPEEKVNSGHGLLQQQAESVHEANPNQDGGFQESTEHNLPDSPFASPPAKSPFMPDSFFSAGEDTSASCITNNSSSSNNSHLIASTTSSLDVPSSFTSCFFPMPRYHPEKICRQTNEFTDFSLITFPPVCAGSPPAMEQLECKGGEEAAAEGEEDVPSSPST
ncbi:hypothetical protein BHE74_00049914 [Ensete ventricosum]|nr:hypothetical protein BHE74_00049914 [Ensete ventricosum]